MESRTVFVNLDYDESTNTLPIEKWTDIKIHGLESHHDPENEAIGFALEMSELDHTEWPEVIYTSLTPPQMGCQVKRHSMSFQ